MIHRSQPFSIQRRVEFRDTDAAGIVHFSAFFPMMESAEHAMLRHLGLSVMQEMPDGSHLSWPRVAASCDYSGAAKFEEMLDILVSVKSLGNKSVTYSFTIQRETDLIACGTVTAVCCLWTAGGKLQSIPIPDDIRSRLATCTLDSA